MGPYRVFKLVVQDLRCPPLQYHRNDRILVREGAGRGCGTYGSLCGAVVLNLLMQGWGRAAGHHPPAFVFYPCCCVAYCISVLP